MQITLKHILLVLGLMPIIVSAQNTGIGMGEWRVHLPYNRCHYITENKDKIFAAADNGFFAYAKSDGSLEKLSTINGFSDGEVNVLDYDPATDKLWICYANSKIDVLKNNKITALDDIFRSTLVGDKRIHNIMFFNRKAYVSTGLGIVVYSEDRMEVSENYLNLGKDLNNTTLPIYGTAVLGDTLFAVTGNSIIFGLIKPNINLADNNNWTVMDTSIGSRHINAFNGKLYAEKDSVLQVWDGSSWTVRYDQSFGTVNSLKVHNGNLVITMGKLIEVIRPDGNSNKMSKNATVMGLVDKNDFYWYVTMGYGLIRVNKDSSETFFTPNGPNSLTSFRMLNYNNAFWVTAGSYSLEYTHTYNMNGYNIIKDNQWTRNPYANSDIFKGLHDFTCMTKHPSENRMFMGTQGKGVIEFEGNTPVRVYNAKNSTLKYFTWTSGGMDKVDSFYYTSGVCYDKNGNLWVSNYDVDSALSVYTADKTWKAFKLPTRYLGEMILDNNGYKWLMTPRPNLSGNGICVFDDNGTPLDENDDRSVLLNTQNAELPTNLVRCLAIMPNGEIWAGTDAGLVVFRNAQNAFSEGFKTDRVIIEQGGVGGYLLGSEVVYFIAVDGSGRRWVGTNKGAWLIDRNGMDILKHYNTENSPLPSDNVLSVGIDEITGEVFFNTDKGLFSVKENATKPQEEMSKLKIYPNPVRSDFDGEVAIEGLALDARVKITDINGNIIFETVSNGGRAVWNCRTFSGERPATGVYLVFAIDSKGEQKAMGKVLFVR
ncbi:MAG: hypothetical protein KF882_02045 [Bacteroidia bacterium]|nr:hypothetical protein [Bacteroidia bacterium]MCO5254028.1 hypothetical protein [Bacteroidota bacterium]